MRNRHPMCPISTTLHPVTSILEALAAPEAAARWEDSRGLMRRLVERVHWMESTLVRLLRCLGPPLWDGAPVSLECLRGMGGAVL